MEDRSYVGIVMPNDPVSDNAFRRFIEAYGNAWAPKSEKADQITPSPVEATDGTKDALTETIADILA